MSTVEVAMNWLRWTTRGWEALRRTVAGESERAEVTRLVSGLDQLYCPDEALPSPILKAPDDRRCPCCSGSHCLGWRETGHNRGCGGHAEGDKCWRSDPDGVRLDGCGGEGEPVPLGVAFRHVMEHAFLNPGRHTLRYIARHPVPWNWSPIPLRTRVHLWPLHYARKLGRPVQLGYRFAAVLP